MLTALSELDTSLRYQLFCLANLVLVVWTRYVVAPAKVGWRRWWLAQPMFITCAVICFLFSVDNPEDRTILSHMVTNYMWLTPWKIFGLCINRTQLTKAYESGSLSAFVVALLLNVNVAFEAKPVAEKKKTDDEDSTPLKDASAVYEDVYFVAIKYSGMTLFKQILLAILQIIRKIVMTIAFIILMRRAEPGTLYHHAMGTWFLFSFCSGLQDFALLISLVTLNLKLDGNFNQPYLSASFGEFWGKRWNLVMGTQLRQIIYEPIVEGKLTASGKYSSRPRASIAARSLGIFLTFLASAIIHAFLFKIVCPEMAFPILNFSFFIFASFLVIAELIAKQPMKNSLLFTKILSRLPRVCFILYVHVVMLWLAHLFFWPDMMNSGAFDKIVDKIIEPFPFSV